MITTRRTVLKGLAVSLSAATLGFAARPALAAPSPSPSAPESPFVKGPATPAPTPAPGTGWVRNRQPYTLKSSVSLSEDYFTTDQVVLGDPGDEVQAYTYNGETSAVVLAGGIVSWLTPDPSSPSGWFYEQMSDIQGKVDAISVGTDADGQVYMLWAITDDTGQQNTMPIHLTESGGNWTSAGPLLPGIPAGATLRCCYDLDRRLNFYGVASDGSFMWWTPGADGFQVITIDTMVGISLQDALLVPTHRPLPNAPLDYLAWALTDTGLSGLVNGTEAPGPKIPGATALYTAGNLDNLPYLTWMEGNTTLSAVYNGGHVDFVNPFTGPPTSLLEVDVVNSDNSKTLTFVMVADGQLYISPVQGNAADGLTVPPSIPVQNQVVSTAVSATGNLDQLFYADAGLALNHLRRNPSTGAWQSFPIHQGGVTNTSVQMWRTELSIADANGIPMSGLDLTLTALGQLDLWHETKGTLLDPGQSVVFTTNSHGRVTVAIPAAELSTAGFSVAADGLAPVSVAPDEDVHTYLSGTGTLNTEPVMSGATLQAAQGSDGTPVFPSSMSSATATAAAAAIGQAMVAGQQGAGQQAPASGQAQSFTVAMTGGSLSYSSSTQTQDLGALLKQVGAPLGSVGGWWHDVKHDAESVYHGIRTGVIDVTHAAGTFLSAADGWAMKLVIAIGDDITDAIDLAVNDLRSAIHFVSSVFHALGADIDKALKWLRAEIAGLFAHTVTAADTLYEWLQAVPKEIGDLLTAARSDLEASFSTIEADISSAFGGDTFNQLSSQNLTSLGTSPPPASQDRRRNTRALADPDPASPTGSNNAHGNWLLHKLESLLPAITSPFSDLLGTKFAVVLETLGEDAYDAVTTDALTLWHAIVDSLSDPRDLKTTGVKDILKALASIINSMMKLLELVIDSMLDVVQAALDGFLDVLTFPLDDIPLIGDLMRLAGVSDNLTFGRLACLVAMFPAVLIKQIATGDSSRELFEFPTDDVARRRAKDGLTITEATGLNYAAASLQGLLTVFGAADDAQEDGPWTAPTFLELFTTGTENVLLAALLVVSYPGDGSPRFSARPFSRPMPIGTPDQRRSVDVYIMSYLEWAFDAVGAYWSNQSDNTARVDALDALKWLNSALGVYLTGFGTYVAGVTKQDGGVIAGQFLSEFTLIWSFLEDNEVQEATEDTSFPAMLLLDFFCGAGAAVAFAAS